MAHDPALGRHVTAPGTSSRSRSEGWASSKVGEHGIRGLPGGRLPEGPKVVFWGDSFVEGVQVDDPERMAQVFTALAREQGLDLSGVGIGTGGDTLIDSIVKAPAYERVLRPVRLNVFVLTRLDDTLPDHPRPCRAALYSAPEPHIAPVDCPPSALALRFGPLLSRLELGGAFAAYVKLRGLSLRLGPGPALAQAVPPAPALSPAERDRLWAYLLEEMCRAAQGPALLLHLPLVPRLDHGAVVATSAEDALARDFAAASTRAGVPFLDLGPALAEHFRATGRLPHGLWNSPPGSGHLNPDGHRLVAQAIANYLQEHRDVLLAP
jgi:lysophospholipase L1-like esterase